MKPLRALTCAACVALAACSVRDATGPGAAAPVGGTWQYSSSQVAPATAQMTGTLNLTVADDGTIAGTASVVESVPGSSDRALSGQVGGWSVTAATVEFTLTIASVARQHFGTQHADTLSGTWLVSDGAAAGASGRFTAVRTQP